MEPEGINLFEESYIGKLFDQPFVGNHWPSDFTYHPVLLPPVECFATAQAARDWVQATRAALTTTSPTLSNLCALDAPPQNPDKHVVIVQSTEFGFNKYKANGNWTADSSHPVRWEVFQEALRGLLEIIRSSQFDKTTIIVAVSAVIDYGPLPPDSSRKIRNLAENAVFVFNNKAIGFQKISKYMRSSADRFNTERFVDLHDARVMTQLEGERVRKDPSYHEKKSAELDTPERRQEMTHTIEDFGGLGKQLCVGIGTCLDASFSKFPDTQLILLLSGGAKKNATRDTSLGTMIVNDALSWFDKTYTLPTVGEWTTKPRSELDKKLYADKTLKKITDANPQLDLNWDRIKEQLTSDLTLGGTTKLTEDQQKWIEDLPLLPIPGGFAGVSFRQTVGITWPLTISEGQWYFRQGEYTKLVGSDIICGTPRKLPSTQWRLGNEDVLAPLQMHMFRDEREFADVREVLKDAAERAKISKTNWQEIWNIVDEELKRTRSQNRPAWEWAQNVARLVKERVADKGIPDNYPWETEAGGVDVRGSINWDPVN